MFSKYYSVMATLD